MGNSASNAARALPKKARAPSAAAARRAPALAPTPTQSTRPPPIARETKDSVIETDGKDPQFLANLSKLGQVNVPHVAGMNAARTTASNVAEIYKARDISEQQAASGEPIRNHLSVGALAGLMDDRKFARSKEDLEQIARRYNVDVDVLEHLVRYVNTPSIGEGTVVRKVNVQDGQESITMKAVWIEPNISDRS